ncbi:stage III sporulation protein AF, partial [Desulforamulus profundi]
MTGLESIKTLVQVLVIIIVLAVFLEMLLPSSQMQDYVKMVMGLLVIIVVL